LGSVVFGFSSILIVKEEVWDALSHAAHNQKIEEK